MSEDATLPPSNGAVLVKVRQGAMQNVVARGEVGSGWALVGARCGITQKLPETELYAQGVWACPLMLMESKLEGEAVLWVSR